MATYEKSFSKSLLQGNNGVVSSLGIQLGQNEYPVSIKFSGGYIWNEDHSNYYVNGEMYSTARNHDFQAAICNTEGKLAHNLNLVQDVPHGGAAGSNGHWSHTSGWIAISKSNTTANPETAWSNLKGAKLALKKIVDSNTCLGSWGSDPYKITVKTSLMPVTITLQADGQGSLSFSNNGMAGTTGQMVDGASAEITIIPVKGYKIKSVTTTSGTVALKSEQATYSVYTFTAATPAVDTTVTATFEPIEYTLTLKSSPEGCGTITVSPVKATYHVGDLITLSQVATEGHEFKGFTINPGTQFSNNVMTMPPSNATVTAYYDGVYQDVTRTAVPTEAGYIYEPGDGKIRTDTVVTLKQKNYAGWAFEKYSLNGTDLSGNTFTVPSTAAQIQAHYARIPYVCEVVKNIQAAPDPTLTNATRRSNSNLYDCNYGEVITVNSNATADTEYKFIGCTMSVRDNSDKTALAGAIEEEQAFMETANEGNTEWNIARDNVLTYQTLSAMENDDSGFTYADSFNVNNSSLELHSQQNFTYPATNIRLNVLYESHNILWEEAPTLDIDQEEYILTFTKSGQATDNMGFDFEYCIYLDFEDESNRRRIATFNAGSDTATFQMTDADIEKTHTYTLVARYQNISMDVLILSDGVTVEYTSLPVHKTIGYYIDGNFTECVPYYYDGQTWVEVEPYYFDGVNFQLCSGDGTMIT